MMGGMVGSNSMVILGVLFICGSCINNIYNYSISRKEIDSFAAEKRDIDSKPVKQFQPESWMMTGIYIAGAWVVLMILTRIMSEFL